jgi:hypothetical protein
VTRFTLRNGDDQRDKMTFRWARGDATSAGELGDPTVATKYFVCVWDYAGGTPSVVMEMVATPAGNCAGRPCWRSTGGGEGYRYKDPGLLPNGIQQLTIRSGSIGRAKVILKGKGALLPDPPMPFQRTPRITVQVVNDLGNCWGADYINVPRVNTEASLIVSERP